MARESVEVKVLLNVYDKNNQGFSLVELVVAMAISGIIVAAIYMAYLSQQRTYLAQDQVVKMQQEVRAALILMSYDFRMAGYNPKGFDGAVFRSANTGEAMFGIDQNGDGDFNDTNEMITYGFAVADDTDRDGIPDSDINGDGVPDALTLRRRDRIFGGYNPMSRNIQAIEFQYLDGSGAPLTPLPLVAADRDKIRSVRISILARAEQPDRKYTDTKIYTTASGTTWGPYNDNYRRRLLISEINCRNMGL
jgi:type IV pilus assembly protein PilW